jgi:hypothetical protein
MAKSGSPFAGPLASAYNPAAITLGLGAET